MIILYQKTLWPYDYVKYYYLTLINMANNGYKH